MARVYVSSTVADLLLERQAVTDWLVAAGHQPVHSYRPDSVTVRDSCLDDVDTCELYVLILGHRYGAQPADGNPEDLSITQLEFRRAGQSGIPQFGDSAPHLTIGHGRPLTDLHAAEESVRGCLPIDAQATAVALVTQQSIEGQWTKAATFPLARQQPAHHEVSLEY